MIHPNELDRIVTVFELDPAVLTTISQDEALREATKCKLFPVFTVPAVEDEYSRFAFISHRWTTLAYTASITFLPFITLAAASNERLRNNSGMITGVSAPFLIACCVLLRKAWSLPADHFASQVRVAKQYEVYSILAAFFLSSVNIVATGLLGAQCGTSNKADEAHCVRAFFVGHPLALALVGFMCRRPIPTLIVQVLVLVVTGVAFGLSPDFPPVYVGLRLLLGITFAAVIAAMCMWRDVSMRVHFMATCRVSYADHILKQEQQRAVEIVDRAMPLALARRLAGSSCRVLEVDTSPCCAVCVTGAAKQPVPLGEEPQSLFETLTLLHNIFTLFDAGVSVFGVDRGSTVGDEFIVTGGLVGGSSSTASRVLRFALWQVELTSTQFPLRSAVAAGEVSGGPLGTDASLRYSVAGMAAVNARRLYQLAAPGELLVHEAVLRMAHVSNVGDIVGRDLAAAYKIAWTEPTAALSSLLGSDSLARHELAVVNGRVAKFVPQFAVTTSPRISSTQTAEALVPRDYATPATKIDFSQAATLFKFANDRSHRRRESQITRLSGSSASEVEIYPSQLTCCGCAFENADHERLYQSHATASIPIAWERVPTCIFILALAMLITGSIERFFGASAPNEANRFRPWDIAGFACLAVTVLLALFALLLTRLCAEVSRKVSDASARTASIPWRYFVATFVLILPLFVAIGLIRESVITSDPHYVTAILAVCIPSVMCRPFTFGFGIVTVLLTISVPIIVIDVLRRPPTVVSVCAYLGMLVVVLAAVGDATVSSRGAFRTQILLRDSAALTLRSRVALQSMASRLVPKHAVESCVASIRRTRFLTADQQLREGGERAAVALLSLQRRPASRRIPVLHHFDSFVMAIIRVQAPAPGLKGSATSLLRGGSSTEDGPDPAYLKQLSPWFRCWMEIHALMASLPAVAEAELEHVQTFGDDMILGGPFTDPTEERLAIAAAAVLQLLDTLRQRAVCDFTATASIGEGAGVVLGHGALRYDVFGAAMQEARDFLLAANDSRNSGISRFTATRAVVNAKFARIAGPGQPPPYVANQALSWTLDDRRIEVYPVVFGTDDVFPQEDETSHPEEAATCGLIDVTAM
jgi:hypothetical protein